MTTVGSKTPVSVVQEYAVRMKLSPNYVLVEQRTGSHHNFFKYHLSVGAYETVGEGSSKQLARQDAASKLIDMLDLVSTPGIGENLKHLSKNQDSFTSHNYIGHLTEYCIKRRYPEPVIDIIDESGPSHAREFTAQCQVSLLITSYISGTKKQAKQLAAKQMLQNLQAQDGEDNIHAVVPVAPVVENKNHSEVWEKWSEVTKTSTFSNIPINKYSDFHLAYECLVNESPTLKKYVTENKKCFVSADLAIMAQELNAEIEIEKIPRDNNTTATLIQLTSNNFRIPLCGMADDEDLAVKDLFNTLMDLIK